jgi:hypothetical protein
MKYKTAFRLLLKGLGIYLIVTAIPMLGHFAGYFLEFVIGGFPSGWVLGYGAQFILQMALGVYLLRGGAWIVNMVIPSNRPYCHECAYELTGLGGDGVCPECGTAFRLAGASETSSGTATAAPPTGPPNPT